MAHGRAVEHVVAPAIDAELGRLAGTCPGGIALVLFKALFDRPKDRVDIAAVVEAGALASPEPVRRWLVEQPWREDARVTRWDALTT